MNSLLAEMCKEKNIYLIDHSWEIMSIMLTEVNFI